ncbi:ABC transporter permease [Agromyces sp. NPDC058484]|uniref:ABC transporter permease n=1 Tax=Agromyces sp. NPDC058484 TaxID=3346524 RepID=UPI0036584368
MNTVSRFTLRGGASLAILAFVLLLVLLGPLVAPYSPTEIAGPPLSGPTTSNLLGTDTLGRDVLSRILHGGLLLALLALASTLITYLIAIPIGMAAAVSKGAIDDVLMRGVDILVAIPALLTLLVVLSASGNSLPAIVLATAVVRVPLVARVTRAATSEVYAKEFVEAAIVRGERTSSVLFREVLPNIRNDVFSTVGLSFTAAVLLISSLNFLGVGIQPPTPDWGIMISENRSIFTINPYSVLVPSLLLALLTIGISGTWDAFQKPNSASRRRTAELQNEN